MPFTWWICNLSFNISKIGNIFEENENKNSDYLMKMIKLTWII